MLYITLEIKASHLERHSEREGKEREVKSKGWTLPRRRKSGAVLTV